MPWYFYGKTGQLVTPKPIGGVPLGAIVVSPIPYTETAPPNYEFCIGQPLSKLTYSDLYGVIGGLYGEDATDFNLPDLRGRFLRGITSSAHGIGDLLGVGGSKSHSHVFAGHQHTYDIPSHAHTLNSHVHTMAHTHDTANHQHTSNYVLGNASPDCYNIDSAFNHQGSALCSHTHYDGSKYVNGLTGLTNPAASGASSDANTGGSSFDSTTVNDPAPALTSGSGGEASTVVTSLPPYLTMTFLMRVSV